MNIRHILFLVFVSALLIGSACGAKTVHDFEIDKDYKNVENQTHYSLYLNDKQDSGITVYDSLGESDTDSSAYDDLIHDDGQEYLQMDDDFEIEKKADNIVEFKDIDHAQHGVVEVVNDDGNQYVVVFWAKDTSDVKNSDLNPLLKEFNKDNDVEAIAF
jgi:hypothetical protein